MIISEILLILLTVQNNAALLPGVTTEILYNAIILQCKLLALTNSFLI